MNERRIGKTSARRSSAAGADRDHLLGLNAFEKISAVEGIRLSREMRGDLESFDAQRLSESERSRFVLEKYGRE